MNPRYGPKPDVLFTAGRIASNVRSEWNNVRNHRAAWRTGQRHFCAVLTASFRCDHV